MKKNWFIAIPIVTKCFNLYISPSSSSPQLFRNIEEFGAKKYYTDDQTVTTIHVLVAKKEIFLVYFSFGQVAAKRHSSETTW